MTAQNGIRLDQTLQRLTGPPTHQKMSVMINDQSPSSIPVSVYPNSVSVKAESLLQLQTWLGSLLIWFGPTIQQDVDKRDGIHKMRSYKIGHGIGLQIRPGTIPGRWCALDCSIMSFMTASRRCTIQWNINLPEIISEDSDIFHFARVANVKAVKAILSSRKGSPFVTTPSGLSLLHVCASTHHPFHVSAHISGYGTDSFSDRLP